MGVVYCWFLCGLLEFGYGLGSRPMRAQYIVRMYVSRSKPDEKTQRDIMTITERMSRNRTRLHHHHQSRMRSSLPHTLLEPTFFHTPLIPNRPPNRVQNDTPPSPDWRPREYGPGHQTSPGNDLVAGPGRCVGAGRRRRWWIQSAGTRLHRFTGRGAGIGSCVDRVFFGVWVWVWDRIGIWIVSGADLEE